MINRLFDLYKACFPEIVREDEKVLKILSFPENYFIVKENDGEISAVSVINDAVMYKHIFLYCMNGHFCFDFKTAGEDREGFNKTETEGTHTCHDIFDIRMECLIDEKTCKPISKIMKRSFIFSKVCTRKSIPYYHICTTI